MVWDAEKRLGGYEPLVLGGLLVVVLATWAFFVIADAVHEGETESLDRKIVRAMRSDRDPSEPIGPPWLAEVCRDVTALGGYAILIMLITGVCVLLQLLGRKASMHFLLAAVLSGYALSMSLKSLFQRPRPDFVVHLSHVDSSSFPSGHSMMSAVVYLTIGALLAVNTSRRSLKAFFLLVAVLLTVLVGLTRVFLGVHYPTDVLAGWAAGLAWATLCCLIAYQLRKRGMVELPTDDDPQPDPQQQPAPRTESASTP
jgi:undecaprenyl-diphosphatase